MAASILVVDDNPVNLRLLRDVLEMTGYEVVTAEDAEQAQELLAGSLPDLLLVDLALPGIDGLTLVRRIKASPRLRHLPIVAVTAFAMKGDDERAIEAGCCAYITKPIDTRQLPQQVAELLAQHTAPRPKVRILVVEDDRIDMKLMGEVLQIDGHVVLGDTSAEAASRTVADDHPDVILLDLQLPGIDGLSFVRQLKSQPETRDIPIVAVTAFEEVYRRDELLAAGCDAYLVKPIDTRDLARQLEAAARRRKAQDGA